MNEHPRRIGDRESGIGGASAGRRAWPWIARWTGALLASAMLLSSCPDCARGGADGGAKPPAPAVRDDSADLSFFWFDSTGAVHRVERISDVPLAARDRVLVQPLDPQKATGAWAFVADLRRAGTDGRFPVQVLTREAYSNEVRARMAAGRPAPTTAASTGAAAAGAGGSAQAKAPPSPPLPAAEKRVVIYVTQACPYCRRAREWMTKVGIPFVERDIEQDAAAARWVMQNTGSTAVPVFQVGARVLQGFNPDALRRAVHEELGIQLL